jgi:hypothetical protein
MEPDGVCLHVDFSCELANVKGQSPKRQSRIGPVSYCRRQHDVEDGEAGDALRERLP